MKKHFVEILSISLIILLSICIVLLLNRIEKLSLEKNILFDNLLSGIKIGMERNVVETIIGKPDETLYLERGGGKANKYLYFFNKVPNNVNKIIVCRYFWGISKSSENAFIYKNDSLSNQNLIYFDNLINISD